MGITIRKRQLEWWRESGEIPDGEHLQEKYDPSRLKPGWSGRDAPPVEKMGSGYAGKEARFDKLGSGSEGAKKTKKGDGQKGAPDVKENKKRVREIGMGNDDLEMPEEMGDEEMGMNPEDDLPPEMEDEALEGEETEELAQDVTVMIDGQEYTLVPKESEEMGMEGEEELEEPAMNEPSEAEMHGGVAAEDEDITQQENKTRKAVKRVREDEGSVPAAGGDPMGEVDYDKVIEQAIGRNSKKEAAIRKALAMKKVAEKQLAELFTGDYVLNKQGEPGFDFRDVAGDESFAVVDRAASGNQYSPTNSKGPYEPSEKGGKTGHMVTPAGAKQEARKRAFQKWLQEQESLLEDEKNPGQDSEQFNKEDMFAKATPISPLVPEEYPETPEKIGQEADVITNGKGGKNFVGEQKKYKDVQQRRKLRKQEIEQSVRFPSKEVKEDLEGTLEESFDFKKFIKGEYSARKLDE
jgi:hypothetical protein